MARPPDVNQGTGGGGGGSCQGRSSQAPPPFQPAPGFEVPSATGSSPSDRWRPPNPEACSGRRGPASSKRSEAGCRLSPNTGGYFLGVFYATLDTADRAAGRAPANGLERALHHERFQGPKNTSAALPRMALTAGQNCFYSCPVGRAWPGGAWGSCSPRAWPGFPAASSLKGASDPFSSTTPPRGCEASYTDPSKHSVKSGCTL